MKATELIETLQQMVATHGDKDVGYIYDGVYYCDIEKGDICIGEDEDGYIPESKGKILLAVVWIVE